MSLFNSTLSFQDSTESRHWQTDRQWLVHQQHNVSKSLKTYTVFSLLTVCLLVRCLYLECKTGAGPAGFQHKGPCNVKQLLTNMISLYVLSHPLFHSDPPPPSPSCSWRSWGQCPGECMMARCLNSPCPAAGPPRPRHVHLPPNSPSETCTSLDLV